MNEEVFCRKNVSFIGHVNKDGQIIKTIGFTLMGEVLILNIDKLSTGMKKLLQSVVPMGNCTFFHAIPLVFSKE